MRTSQQMKLAPRMIQSMEILQMPSQALEERLEQELASNPTLELREVEGDRKEIAAEIEQSRRDASENTREMRVDEPGALNASGQRESDDFERLNNFAEEYGESYSANTYESGDDYRPRRAADDGERDKKLDAIANTAARPRSLGDQLLEQWGLVEVPDDIREAGAFLIGYIDDDGYIRTPMQTILQASPQSMTMELIEASLAKLQQTLEPVGLGARDIRECLLLQIDARIREELRDEMPDEDETSDEARNRNIRARGRANEASSPTPSLFRKQDASTAPLRQSAGANGILSRPTGVVVEDEADSAIPATPLARARHEVALDAQEEADDADDEMLDSDEADDLDGPTGRSTIVASGPLALERILVADFLKDIEANRLPRIAKATGASMDEVKRALLNLRQFRPHPGRELVDESPRAITPDAVVEYDEENDCYIARLFHGRLPSVHINPDYLKMARDSAYDKQTRDFVGNNVRSARWLLDAIQQRHATLLRVIGVVLEAQREFFDLGPQALRPLPMTQVADQLGIHVATVSRAVSEKYIQSPRGIFPLRMFFSGGTETESGDSMSWAAVQAKLQEIIDAEDKANPLNDDELVERLKAAGIDIARRTVAKYRKQMNIATARQRTVY